MADDGYENQISAAVAKLLLRDKVEWKNWRQSAPGLGVCAGAKSGAAFH
jgi:hypothetical protein